MSDAWKSYRGAPAEGAVICKEDAIPDGGTLCLEREGFPLILLRAGGELRAFVNACPHQYLPLNHRSESLLSADGTKLRCSMHGAGFDAKTGEGVEGPGAGLCLDPVPVSLNEAGEVVIG